MIVLKTDLVHRWGTQRVLPIVGEVSVSESGTIEVPTQEIAEQVANSGCGFFIVIEEEVEKGTTTPSAAEELEKTKETPVKPDVLQPKADIGTEELDKTDPVDDIKGLNSTNDLQQGLGTDVTTEEQKVKEGDLSDPKSPENDIKEQTDDINKLENELTGDNERDLKAELTSLTYVKLQELAKPFPKKEWNNLKKDDLVDYLVKQIPVTKESVTEEK